MINHHVQAFYRQILMIYRHFSAVYRPDFLIYRRMGTIINFQNRITPLKIVPGRFYEWT